MIDADSFLAPEFEKVAQLGAVPESVPTDALLRGLEASLPCGFLNGSSFSTTLVLPAEPRHTLRTVLFLLAQHGEVVAGPPGGSRVPCLAGSVMSGFLGLNRTAVVVQMTAAEGGSCTLVLSAIAKEGLIHQHSAEKAVRALEHELRRAIV